MPTVTSVLPFLPSKRTLILFGAATHQIKDYNSRFPYSYVTTGRKNRAAGREGEEKKEDVKGDEGGDEIILRKKCSHQTRQN